MNDESDRKRFPGNRRPVLPAIFLACISLILWTCVTPYQQLLDKPKLEYQGMEMTGSSVYEVTPVFNFQVVNTNPMGMSISSVDYDLEINQETFVKGMLGEKSRVKGADSVIVKLPVSFNFKDLFDTSEQLKKTSEVQYSLSGVMKIGPFPVPYQVSGEFKVPKENGNETSDAASSD